MNTKLLCTGLIAFAVSMNISLFAQEIEPAGNYNQCGFKAPPPVWDDWFNEAVEKHKLERASGRQVAKRTIPVIIHVIHAGEAKGTFPNLSNEQLVSQIKVFNDDFAGKGYNTGNIPAIWKSLIADAGVEFCLAVKDPNGKTLAEPGIERINYNTLSGVSNPKSGSAGSNNNIFLNYLDTKLKPATIWDVSKYLNIWVTDRPSDGTGLGVAMAPPGTTTLPGGNIYAVGTSKTDGLWCWAKCFGTTGTLASGYTYGRVSSHEIGHYLGLHHLWGTGNSTCETDYCNDTPTQSGPNFNCPVFPTNKGKCSGNTTGEMTMNIMDYTNDDCKYFFTPDQVARIQTALAESPNRKYLGTHGLCESNAPSVSNFSADKTYGCSSLAVQFKDESSGSPTSWSWDFGDGTTSAQQNPSHTYQKAGNYTVKLTASNQFGGDTKTRNQYIVIGDGTPYTAVKGGPADNTLGAGGNFNNSDARGLLFDVKDSLLIESVKVYASGAGERTIQVLNSVGGTVLQSKTVNIPDGENRVPLGFSLPPGNQYFMKVTGTNVNLYRNNAGAKFPYQIQGLLSITQTDYASTDPNYYYYFFDWEVRKNGCNTVTGSKASESIQKAQLYPNPAINYVEVMLPEQVKEAMHISLLNYQGQTVKQLSIAPGTRKVTVDIHALPEGIYLVQIGNLKGIAAHFKITKFQ